MTRRNILLTFGILVCMAGVLHAQSDTLTIVHINDSHSHLVPYGPKARNSDGPGTLGGIARAATHIAAIQAMEEDVLFLHAGDLFVGDAMFNKYFGVPELQILAQLGCDALTLGNHEFDLTPDVLTMALTEAGFPIPGFDILSANLDMSDPNAAPLDAMVEPYTIRQVGDLTVGIFGLTTEETNEFSMPGCVSITSCVDGAVAMVTELTPQCDLIIGLTHLGLGVDIQIAQNIPGIDLIVGGHSHDVTTEPLAVTDPLGGTTWIVQAGEFYNYVGDLKLAVSPEGTEIVSYDLLPVDDSIPPVPEIAAIIDGLIQDLEADPRYGPLYTEMIAVAEEDIEEELLEGDRRKDTAMGNLVTDACRSETGTDIAMAVTGFISQTLYARPLSGADVFQAIPYGFNPESGHGFSIVTFELSGLELLMGLEFTTEQAPFLHDLYVQVSGMSFQYDPSKPMGEKIDWVMIGEEPLDPNAMYTVTTNSGVASMLGMAGLEPHNLQDIGRSEFQVLRDFIVENSPLSYQVEGRIIAIYRPSDRVAQLGSGNISPQTQILCWNTPNPFEYETEITYFIPEEARVRVEILNFAGQRVAKLTDQWQSPGVKTIRWEAGSLPSGVYFHRLTADDQVLVHPMILRK